MSRAAVVNGFDSPLAVILSAVALEGLGDRRGGSWLKVFLRKLGGLATNPLVISAVGGLLVSYFRVPVLKVGILDELLSLLAATSLPLALLSIGCSIELGSLKKNLRLVLAVTAVMGLLLFILDGALVWLVNLITGV